MFQSWVAHLYPDINPAGGANQIRTVNLKHVIADSIQLLPDSLNGIPLNVYVNPVGVPGRGSVHNQDIRKEKIPHNMRLRWNGQDTQFETHWDMCWYSHSSFWAAKFCS
jgi:hypothetical protein